MDAQTYPGKSLSLSQLIFALNEELKRTAYSPSFTFETVSQLEGDTSIALATIREWKNSFARINRIPLDVLSLIPIHLQSQCDRLRASFVCRHWRGTFLQRAELWSRLYLPKGETYVKTLLARAKGSVLDVHFTRQIPSNTMTLLSSHAKQIGYLSFTHQKWADIQTFLRLNSEPLPLLHTLKIYSTVTEDGLDSSELTSLSLPLFSNAPNLKKFRFHSNLDWPPFLSQFVFPNIVSFQFSGRLPEGLLGLQLLDFLEGSPMLRTVDMQITWGISLEDVPRERVVLLPNVERFELFVVDGGPAYKIATCISCPSAKHTLLLHNKYDYQTTPEEMFPSVVSWNVIVRQYTSSPAEEVELEIRSTSAISCNLSFRTPDKACITLGFSAVPDDGEEDEGDEDELDLRSAVLHHEIFTQATMTIRNYSQLVHVKRLRIYHSFTCILSASVPLIANEVGELFNALGPLDELTLDRCDLRPYFHSPLNTLEGYIEEPVVFPSIKKLTISHPVYSSDGQFTAAIVGLVRSHYTRGIPFERVMIRNESMPVGMEEELKLWVRSVEYCHELSNTDDY